MNTEAILNPTPWSQINDLSVVRDANGKLLSFHDHAPRIVKAVNFEPPARVHLTALIKAVLQATGPRATASDTMALIMAAQAANMFLGGRKE